jgi:hypothetical protein
MTSFQGGMMIPHIRYIVYLQFASPTAYPPVNLSFQWPGLIDATTVPFPTDNTRLQTPFDTEPKVAQEFTGTPITISMPDYDLVLTGASLDPNPFNSQTGYHTLNANLTFSITNKSGYSLNSQTNFPTVLVVIDHDQYAQTKLDPRDFDVAPGATRTNVKPVLYGTINQDRDKMCWVLILSADGQPLAQVLQ